MKQGILFLKTPIEMKLSLIIVFFLFLSSILTASTIIVDANGAIKTPEAALQLAKPGDRIEVKSAIYHNVELIINKPVELIGDNFPTLDGNHLGNVISVQADNVSISGFVIENSAANEVVDYAGIKVVNEHNCRFSNLHLLNNYFSLLCEHCSTCIIENNVIMSNATQEALSGNGIHLWNCDSMQIINNTISHQRDGIYFEFTKNSVITNNSSNNNLRYGLHFMFSNNDIYRNNDFFNNGSGVAVMYSHGIIMNGNSFHDNWGGAAYGLLLKEISNCIIENNIFKNNTIGIDLEGAIRLNVTKNEFTANGYALKIFGDCSNDTIDNNDFTDNSYDVAANTNTSGAVNIFSGNYWDKYDGYDLNKDGIGDVPYRPVSLFSMMAESNPNATVLLGSFIVNLLDAVEKILPGFIPESVIDNTPRMRKNCSIKTNIIGYRSH